MSPEIISAFTSSNKSLFAVAIFGGTKRRHTEASHHTSMTNELEFGS